MKTVLSLIGVITTLFFVGAICSTKTIESETITPETTTVAETTTLEETTTEIEPETTTTTTKPTTTKRETTTESTFRVYDDNEYIAPEYFRKMGVIYADGYIYKWYSENVLPGKGLKIPGRHSDGNYVLDEEDYIVLASIDLPKGTVMETPFGWGKVYDVCPTSGIVDVYVSW